MMIYLRRKLLKAAKALQNGIEPSEPWKPELWHYHAASAVIENGDYQAAIKEALERGKTSVVPDEMRKVAAAIAV